MSEERERERERDEKGRKGKRLKKSWIF